MSLPTKSDLQTMDWSFRGQPFVRVPANDSIDTDTLDWSFRGQPYWCISGEGGEPPQPPSRIYTVPYEDTNYIVPCENMTYPVPYEDTTYIVPFCQKK